jgi:tRNA modification GTPase
MAADKNDGVGDDTVVAVITPPGEGGIAALRLAGPKSLELLNRCFVSKSGKDSSMIPFMLRYGHFVKRSGEKLDEVMAVHMPEGKSYTGLDQVEIYCHGGRHVVSLLLEELIQRGARAAEPGEFTRLAFLNGRIDLAKAEAVAEIIAANTDASYRASREHLLGEYSESINRIRDDLVDVLADIEASIDFPEEETDLSDSNRQVASIDRLGDRIGVLLSSYSGGRIIKEGFKVAICGRPNAGKSTLFNLLLRQERALVNPVAGTTRDYLSEWIDLEGVAVNLIDTAGLRRRGGRVEREGQRRTKKIIDQSDLVIWMVDLSEQDWPECLKADRKSLRGKEIMFVGNKLDLAAYADDLRVLDYSDIMPLSCVTEDGFDILKEEIVKVISGKMPDLTSGVVVTSARHKQKLSLALESLNSARTKVEKGESPELTAFDLRQAKDALDEITGKVYTEDILGKIFSSFCIGK